MNLKCELLKKTSKKGNDYFVIEITLPNGYKKSIFPDYSEKFIIEGIYKEN